MGKSAAEIEYDNERRRHALSARVSRLERRLRDDAGSVVATARGDADSAVTTVAEKVSAVAGTTAGSGTPVAQHPKPLLAGALAAGGLLGFATGGAGDQEDAPHKNGAKRGGEQSLATHAPRASGILASLASAGQGLLAARLGGLAHDVFEDVFGKARDAVGSKPTKAAPAKANGNGHHDPVVGAETAADIGAGSPGVLGSAWDRLPEHRSAHPAGAPWAPEEVDVH